MVIVGYHENFRFYLLQLGAGVGGCKVCNQSVFLAQRLLISGHLFHRTCFKCARCSALLSVANYYETQDGKYCCETCPDEESRTASLSSVEDGRGSLVGNRRALFETLAAADCTDDVKALKKAQRPITLKMTDSIIEEKITCSDDNDSGVIVSDKKELSDVKTSTSVSGSHESLSDMLVDEPREDAFVVSDDKIVSPSIIESSDTINPIMDDDKDLLDTNKSTRVLLSKDLKQLDDERVEEEIHTKPSKDNQMSLPDDLKQVLEYPSGKDAKDQVESPEDLEIKTLANKLLKMDYYESSKELPIPSPRKKIKSPTKLDYPLNLNPFDDDEDLHEEKNNSTNPFGSDLEDEDEPITKTNVSLNPFSSDEDEIETLPQSQPPLPKPR